MHGEARDELIEGLLALGVLEGSRDTVLEDQSFKTFFPQKFAVKIEAKDADIAKVGINAFAVCDRCL